MLHIILPLFGLTVLLVQLLRSAFRRDLSWVPGPLLSRFSNLYRQNLCLRGKLIEENVAAHKKYGKLVRWGPNMVTVSDPEMVDQIFGHRNDFQKSDMIIPWQKRINGKAVTGIVDTKDRKLHAQLKRPVASTFAASNINANEVFIDETISYFVKRLDEVFIQTGQACGIDEWLQYFAFDVIGEITMSRRFGLLEAGADSEHILEDIANEHLYRTRTGQMPWTHFLLKGNPLYQKIFKPTNKFTTKAAEMIKDKQNNGSVDPEREDMMHKFLEAQKKYPAIVDDNILRVYVMTNLLAGSDTTACVMRTAIYYGIKNPETWKKVQEELDDNSTTYPPTFKQSMALPYVDAFITESLRIHPIGAFPFERVVPPEGMTMPDNHTLPGGTIIGVNPWVTHFDRDVFGEDADQFKPERWLMQEKESEEAYTARLARMRYSDFAFSRGPRKCLGIHIAQQELWKTIPTLIGLFNMRLAKGPDHEWKLDMTSFSKQLDMDVIIEWREGKSIADLKVIDPGDYE